MNEVAVDDMTGVAGSDARVPARSSVSWLRSPTVLFVVAAGIVAGVYLFLVTPGGLYQYPDSVAYVGAAHNVLDGRGLTLPFVPPDAPTAPSRAASFGGRAPLYQYSPLLPAVLAAPIGAGVDAFAAARMLNVVCWGAAAALVAWAVLCLTRGSYLAAALTLFLLATTAWYLTVQTALLAEPLFVVLSLGALGALARVITAPSRRIELAFVALAAAAALSRYVGVAVIGTGVISILLWYPKPLASRVRRALAVGAIAAVPLAVWVVTDNGRQGSGRNFAFHPPGIAGWHLAENSVVSWLTAGGTKDAFLRGFDHYATISRAERLFTLAFVVLLAVALVMGVRRASRTSGTSPDTDRAMERALVRVGLVFLGLYVVVLFATISFVDASPTFGDRMFAPLPAVFWPLAVATLWRVFRTRWTGPRVATTSVAAALALVVVLVWHVDHAPQQFHRARTSAVFFNHGSRGKFHGPMMAALRRLPRHDPVFTDQTVGVYDATKRFAVNLPQRISAWTGKPNREFAAQEEEIGTALCDHRGVAILFAPSTTAFFLAVPPERVAAERRAFEQTLSRLERSAGLHVSATYSDGVVLEVDRARCTR